MSQRPKRRGQSLVEFALIAPIFFFLVIGIIEGGRLLWTFHTLNNAAKEGSRYTMVRGTNSELGDAPATDSTIETYILSKSSGLADADLTTNLVLLDGDMDNKSRFRVEVSYDYSFVVGAFLGVSDMTITADSTAIFSR